MLGPKGYMSQEKEEICSVYARMANKDDKSGAGNKVLRSTVPSFITLSCGSVWPFLTYECIQQGRDAQEIIAQGETW